MKFKEVEDTGQIVYRIIRQGLSILDFGSRILDLKASASILDF